LSTTELSSDTTAVSTADAEAIAEFFGTTPADTLRRDLMTVIHARNDATPRHRQTELGVSDVSHPCHRRLAYALAGVEPSNPPFDPLPSIIGSAAHD
jgi:hypothetical protein